MRTLLQDLRFGARMLLKNSGFTLIAVITLALGIGATTAIFSVVNSVLLHPLPYPDADRLLMIGQQYKDGLAGAGEPKFLFWREHCQSFEAMAAYSNYGGAGGNLTGGSEAEFVRGLRVSAEFFRVLGVAPVQGRAFTAVEDTPGAERVAVLGHGLWQRRFGGARDLIGKTVQLNEKPVTVVGIMPPNFRLESNVDLFVPMQAKPTANYDPNATVIGKLKPGVTLEQAQTELKLVAEKFRATFPRQMQEGESLGAQSYQELFVGEVRQYLWILLGAVGFLLLIACANVANLQLTRAASRQKEIAVRMALGAKASRVMGQLLTEGVLLSLLGGVAGVLLAAWGTDVLLAVVPEGLLPSVAEIKLDWRVPAFAFVASLATGLLFGLAPAWQARHVDVNKTLKEQSGKGSVVRGRLRGALVVAEVALALVLLIGAGLLARTFANLLNVSPGFDPHNVLTFKVALDGARYAASNDAAAFYRDALERIRHLPGVEAAAITNKLPLDWQFNMPVVLNGDRDQVKSVQFRMISADYFNVMKIPVRQGRAFTEADNAAAQPAAIVNEAFIQRFFAGQNPFAQQLSIGRTLNDSSRQVIGVVADNKQHGLDRPAAPTVFVPIPQVPDKLMASVRAFTDANFTVRTTVEPHSLTAAIKRELAAIDPSVPLSNVSSMEELTALSIASQRFNMLLLGLFSGLGLLLAGVGIYGVMAYSVSQRTNEIGIRIALGAQSRDVLRLVIRQGMALALFGMGIGMLAAFGLTRLMSGLLFGIKATDPMTFAAIGLVLGLVALLACWIPARRATKVDPMVALRYE